MNNQKCQELYGAFVLLLGQHEFHWVIGQVEEQIRLGKTAPERIAPPHGPQLDLLEPDDEPTARGGRSRASREIYLKRIPYTPCERLVLIIEATEHAVVDVGEIGSHLAEFLRRQPAAMREVKFAQEDESILEKPFLFADALSRKPAIAELRSLLAKLKAEVCKHAN